MKFFISLWYRISGWYFNKTMDRWWKRRHAIPWSEHLVDMKDFADHVIYGKWHKRKYREYVLYQQVDKRWVIYQESPDPRNMLIGLVRDECCWEKGIDINTLDDEAFAKSLVDTLFQHTSYNSRKPIIKALLQMQREFEIQREVSEAQY